MLNRVTCFRFLHESIAAFRCFPCLHIHHESIRHPLNQEWVLCQPSAITSLLDHCTTMEELKQIHAQMITTGMIQETFFASRLLAFCTVPSSGRLDYASCVFGQIPHPNLFMWNSMIRACAHSRLTKMAFSLYNQMLDRGFSPDKYTFPFLIKASIHNSSIEQGTMIHGQIIKLGFERDAFVMSAIIKLYSLSGRIETARQLFDESPERDVVLWTTMVAAYAHLGDSEEALKLFDQMQVSGVIPNKVTVVSLLSACARFHALGRGQWLHSFIKDNKIRCDVLVGNALVNMYTKCGDLQNAGQVFNNMKMKNTVSWNVLIGGFVQNNLPAEALALFQKMKQNGMKPSEVTMVNLLSACARLGDLEEGKNLHSYINDYNINWDTFVRNALINMYAKCGDMNSAAQVFHTIPTSEKDVVTWTTMITGYVQGNCFKEALSLFHMMQTSRVPPNAVTLVSLLSACAQLGALEQGKWIHAYIDEKLVKSDVFVGNALVDMYSKCGCIEKAVQIFHNIPKKDIFSWNSVIGGLAVNGYGREALAIFGQLLEESDIFPDHVTLTAVLCACSHAGMVSEGMDHFSNMKNLYNISPTIEHYGCMVDLLGRAGLLKEAVSFTEKMPFEPNSIIYGSLLSACRVHHELELGELIAEEILMLAPNDDGAYILLSNMYSEAGKWNKVRRVRRKMGSQGIDKAPGCSLVEVNGIVHEFLAGDTSHPQCGEIYLNLMHLNSLICHASDLV
ncbi:Pentatricopeptide repeat-containing protein [Nymphaea thermarum]|nr:Pentatricopeptide repeat-containing protein [Nymphaea thermarum]